MGNSPLIVPANYYDIHTLSCHEHVTRPDEQNELWAYRADLTTRFGGGGPKMELKPLKIEDESIRRSLESHQLKLMQEYGVKGAIFTGRASWALFPGATRKVQNQWNRTQNDVTFQACNLDPKHLIPGFWIPPITENPRTVDDALAEMERCAKLGAVVCNINPFSNGNIGGNVPLWHDLYKPIFALARKLSLTIMIHASCSCVVGLETTADFYLNAMNTAVCQLAVSTVLEDNEDINIVIAQGGGGIPFQLGRLHTLVCYKGKVNWPEFIDRLWWDTCLYGDAEMQFFLENMPVDRMLLGLELYGACGGKDFGNNPAEDTVGRIERIVRKHGVITAEQQQAIFRDNHWAAYPLLQKWLDGAHAV